MRGYVALAVAGGLLAGSALARALSPEQGAIVPTERTSTAIAPGPEADVTLFASGEALGKIEPCG